LLTEKSTDPIHMVLAAYSYAVWVTLTLLICDLI
jgi:hypothetical protein